jgi:hypothetical protein
MDHEERLVWNVVHLRYCLDINHGQERERLDGNWWRRQGGGFQRDWERSAIALMYHVLRAHLDEAGFCKMP